MSDFLRTGYLFDGNYELIDVLGSGGIGTVFRARQLDLNRIVAVKVFHHTAVADHEFSKRFVTEAQSLCQLSHPGIVTVFKIGISSEKLPYLVMEYIEGSSLASLLQRDERIGTLRALKLTRELALALAEVHKHGIVHRDIKPANMILSNTPDPNAIKLIDFGLARIDTESAQDQTKTGTLLGTAQYMSPEQCAGKRVDHRSDIYTLCCCLYEMISGELPFTADNAIGVLYKHINVALPKLDRNRVDHYHPKLDELLEKGMAKAPEARFQSMNQLAQVIEQVESACQLVGSEKTSPQWVIASSILACILAVVVGTNIFWRKQPEASKQMTVPVSASHTLETLLKEQWNATEAERLLILQEGYLLSKRKRINQYLRRDISISYGISLLENHFPSQALSLREALAKDNDFNETINWRLRRTELLVQTKQFKRAKEEMELLIKNASMAKTPPALLNYALEISADKIVREFCTKCESCGHRLIEIALILRVFGRLDEAEAMLHAASSTSITDANEFELIKQRVLLNIAEADYQKAKVEISDCSKRMRVYEAPEGFTDIFKRNQIQLAELEQLLALLDGEKTCAIKEKDSANVEDFFRKANDLRSQRKASDLTSHLEKSKNLRLSAASTCQLLSLKLWAQHELRSESNNNLILRASAYRIVKDNPRSDFPEVTYYVAMANWARTLRDLGDFKNAERVFKELLSKQHKLARLNENDRTDWLNNTSIVWTKLDYARMLRRWGKEKEADKLFDNERLDQIEPGGIMSLFEYNLKFGNKSKAQILLKLPELGARDYFRMTEIALDQHELDTAKLCIEQSRARLEKANPKVRYGQEQISRLQSCCIEIEAERKTEAEKILRSFIQNLDKNPDPKRDIGDQLHLLSTFSAIAGILNLEKERQELRTLFFKLQAPQSKIWQDLSHALP